MTDQMTIKKATRTGIVPLIGLVGLAGGGKSLTGLFVARGFVGPSGKIGCIDTENKRALHFADQVEFDHISLEPPFSPARYGQALATFEKAGYGAVVVDSMTHEWNGDGGYLDLKEAEIERMTKGDWSKRDKCALAAAARIKPEHNRLLSQILRSGMLVILCFRGKQKVRIEKNQKTGKTAIETDDHISPIQDSGLIFECLIAGEVFAKEQELAGVQTRVGGYFRCQKHTVASLLSIIPKDNEQMGVKFGEQLAKWCSAGSSPAQSSLPPAASLPASKQTEDIGKADSALKVLKNKLWKLTDKKHGGIAEALEQWLIDEALISDTETLADFGTVARMTDLIAKVERKLKSKP